MTAKKAGTKKDTKTATPSQPAGPGTVNENMPAAPDPATATGDESPLTAPKKAATVLPQVPQKKVTGAPHAEPTGKIEPPQATKAQLAAGPDRPEPATPVTVDPISGIPSDVDVQKVLDAPIKWIRVRATKTGFTGVGAAGVRRRAGDVFSVDERFYSASWMELVPAATPERTRTGQDLINEQHDNQLGGKVSRPTGDADALGANVDA